MTLWGLKSYSASPLFDSIASIITSRTALDYSARSHSLRQWPEISLSYQRIFKPREKGHHVSSPRKPPPAKKQAHSQLQLNWQPGRGEMKGGGQCSHIIVGVPRGLSHRNSPKADQLGECEPACMKKKSILLLWCHILGNWNVIIRPEGEE